MVIGGVFLEKNVKVLKKVIDGELCGTKNDGLGRSRWLIYPSKNFCVKAESYLLQEEEFKNLGILFTNDERVEMDHFYGPYRFQSSPKFMRCGS